MDWLDYCKQQIPFIQETYLKRMGVPLNLSNPRTFTEKLQWLKIYDSSFLKTYCADKVSLHAYCQSKLGYDMCIPLIGVYETASQIPFDRLPNGVVFKCNHGSGYNIICKPSQPLDYNRIRRALTKWLLEDFSLRNGSELHYKLIPRKILIEPYMNDGHADLVDYKFYCFNGRPVFCQVITDRRTHEKISHFIDGWVYAPQYDWVEFESDSGIQCPKHYEKMLDISTKLSKAFKMVRVDFYVIADKLYLGELTFTPNSGYHHFKDPHINIELGRMLHI